MVKVGTQFVIVGCFDKCRLLLRGNKLISENWFLNTLVFFIFTPKRKPLWYPLVIGFDIFYRCEGRQQVDGFCNCVSSILNSAPNWYKQAYSADLKRTFWAPQNVTRGNVFLLLIIWQRTLHQASYICTHRDRLWSVFQQFVHRKLIFWFDCFG